MVTFHFDQFGSFAERPDKMSKDGTKFFQQEIETASNSLKTVKSKFMLTCNCNFTFLAFYRYFRICQTSLSINCSSHLKVAIKKQQLRGFHPPR